MIKRYSKRSKPAKLISAAVIAIILLFSCGLTAFAEESTQKTNELFPADVQTVIEDGTRQIIKIYNLTNEQNPEDIPRGSFEAGGWLYNLTDITQRQTTKTDIRNHTEIITINTDTKDINAIITQLSQTLDYQADDGYCGILTLDLSSVKCEVAGYKNSSYTVTATREYPHLSVKDLSLIPKSITDNGQTLQFDDVTWEVQHYINVDYQDIPGIYRAVAKYSAKVTKTVATGYITTAEYTGEIKGIVTGDTVYTAYFTGSEITPEPNSSDPPPETAEQIETSPNGTEIEQENNKSLLLPFLNGIAVIAIIAAATSLILLRRNVKIYRNGFSVLAAKDRISAKNPFIDLSPLEGECFGIEINKNTAKILNGFPIEIRHDSIILSHTIAYEGSTYRIKADFIERSIEAIY